MNQNRPLVVVGVALALFAAVFYFRESAEAGPGESSPQADGTTTTVPGGPDSTSTTLVDPPFDNARVGYLVSREGAILRPSAGGDGQAIAGGITFPVLATESDGFRILDVCGREGWLASTDVDQGMVPTDRVAGLDQAVLVIDPGHGYPDLGVVGPTRLYESVVNLDISARLAELLRAPRDVNWDNGAITAGTTYPAVAAAILTRGPDGPAEGDYEMSLTFRAEVANSAEATALISIHNNSSPARDLDHPGSEVYVQVNNPESARLGGLIVEELRTELARFEADWMGGAGNGLRSRLGSTGGDYYTVLDETDGVAVIVEGAYVSNPSEEAVIRTEAFRQSYAEAVYRAIVRWVTTSDSPLPAPTPEAYSGPGGAGRDWSNCVVPPAGS